VRIVAIGDEPVGVRGHARGEGRVQIEHAEQRQVGEAGQSAQPGQKLAFGIVVARGRHGAVQRQPNAVDPAGGGRARGRFEARPEPFEHLVLDRAGGRGR
jgi:hypothetical protein